MRPTRLSLSLMSFTLQICPCATVCVDPDSRDEPLSPRVEDIIPYVAKYFKGVSTTPSIYEACIITVRSLYFKPRELRRECSTYRLFWYKLLVTLLLMPESTAHFVWGLVSCTNCSTHIVPSLTLHDSCSSWERRGGETKCNGVCSSTDQIYRYTIYGCIFQCL